MLFTEENLFVGAKFTRLVLCQKYDNTFVASVSLRGTIVALDIPNGTYTFIDDINNQPQQTFISDLVGKQSGGSVICCSADEEQDYLNKHEFDDIAKHDAMQRYMMSRRNNYIAGSLEPANVLKINGLYNKIIKTHDLLNSAVKRLK